MGLSKEDLLTTSIDLNLLVAITCFGSISGMLFINDVPVKIVVNPLGMYEIIVLKEAQLY